MIPEFTIVAHGEIDFGAKDLFFDESGWKLEFIHWRAGELKLSTAREKDPIRVWSLP
jgi:hypothetical protein